MKSPYEDCMTVSEFAHKMRVTTRTVHNWRRDGRVVAILLPNGRYLIPRSEYDRIMNFGTGAIVAEPETVPA